MFGWSVPIETLTLDDPEIAEEAEIREIREISVDQQVPGYLFDVLKDW